MTKPQALPFLVPFGAWFLATQGIRGTLKAAAVGAVVVVLLWLPFIAAGGPGNYLNNLATYQNDIFAILSLKAWNPWALLQELGANGQFVSDRTAAFGPLTFRHRRLRRWPGCSRSSCSSRSTGGRRRTSSPSGSPRSRSPRSSSLTTMHERYAYPALVFLLLALGRPAVAVAWIAVRGHVPAEPAGRRPARGLDDPCRRGR